MHNKALEVNTFQRKGSVICQLVDELDTIYLTILIIKNTILLY